MSDTVDPNEGSMSLLDHLTELRNRIGIVFITFCGDFFGLFYSAFWLWKPEYSGFDLSLATSPACRQRRGKPDDLYRFA